MKRLPRIDPQVVTASKPEKSDSPEKPEVWLDLFRSCLAEFLGTTMLVFLGVLSSALGVFSAFGFGFTTASLIAMFGPISGGLFNPGLTTAAWIVGSLPLFKLILYILCQVLGGLVGALFLKAVIAENGCPISYNTPVDCNVSSIFVSVEKRGIAIMGGVNNPVNGTSWQQALAMETILTFILMLTFLLLENDIQELKPKFFYMSVIGGFVVVVLVLAGCQISGPSMNSARSFGPAVVYSAFGFGGSSVWKYHYVYWVGPFSGAILAALIYKLLLGSKRERWSINFGKQPTTY